MIQSSIFCCRQQGAICSSGLLKLDYFHRCQRERCSPSQAAFLLQCPYLVNCSELEEPWITERRREAATPTPSTLPPKKPQRKRQICPRPRHSCTRPATARTRLGSGTVRRIVQQIHHCYIHGSVTDIQ